MLGAALGWSVPSLAILEFGALMHDIGKIIIPETVLNKPGHLTPEELTVMRNHTVAGARIIDGISHLRDARQCILYHHEKWDGSGYPEGLKGEEIPPEGRLLAIVDVYDALTSDRPYHKGITSQEAMDFLRKGAGTHFDEQMVHVFCEIKK
jgi:HD-GYP domain-containing protein (c-di-GMP phosphodiesterase class II)